MKLFVRMLVMCVIGSVQAESLRVPERPVWMDDRGFYAYDTMYYLNALRAHLVDPWNGGFSSFLTAMRNGALEIPSPVRGKYLYKSKNNNFHVACETTAHHGTLSRSAQPTLADIQKLAQAGVRIVVNLYQSECEADPVLVSAIRTSGMQPYFLPLDEKRILRPDEVASLLEIFDRHQDEWIHVHCKGGRDRTGLAVALYMLEIGKLSLESALSIGFGTRMNEYGHQERIKPCPKFFIRLWAALGGSEHPSMWQCLQREHIERYQAWCASNAIVFDGTR